MEKLSREICLQQHQRREEEEEEKKKKKKPHLATASSAKA
jgi:hypothetical protein